MQRLFSPLTPAPPISARRHTLPAIGNTLLCLWLLAAIFLFPFPAAAAKAPSSSAKSFSAPRPFSGIVRRDMAEKAAHTAAVLTAYEHAARELASDPDIAFAGSEKAPGAMRPSLLDGLARMLYSTKKQSVTTDGFPPHLQAVVTVALFAPQDKRAALQQALSSQDRMEVYAQIAAAQADLLRRYDDLSVPMLPLRPIEQGGKEELHRLQNIINQMVALEQYLALMENYGQFWPNPAAARDTLLSISALAPDTPLIAAALAEAYLQLDRPLVALEYVGKALEQLPYFARAHDIKGTIFLHQRLPALAADSFSRAIELNPTNPAYYLHRGSAYMLLEENEAMCADFRRLCALGDCELYEWAGAAKRCTTGKE